MVDFRSRVNPIARYNSIRPLVHWYNARRLKNYVFREIDSCFAKHQNEARRSAKEHESITDLTLPAYLSKDAARKTRAMNSTFKKFTISQTKLFLFSGYDTTSSTVYFLFYVLATNPRAHSCPRRTYRDLRARRLQNYLPHRLKPRSIEPASIHPYHHQRNDTPVPRRLQHPHRRAGFPRH